MNQNENGLPGSQRGFEEALQILEAFKEMATKVIEELIRKPAVNKTYKYYEYHAPVYQYNGIDENKECTNETNATDKVVTEEKKATKEMMSRAAKITIDGGLWKSQRSWSVTFIVYGIWEYKGTVTEFLAEVPTWPDRLTARIACNRDAVEKLKNMYHFTKNINEWRSNGIPEQYCLLGEQLDMELEKMVSSDSA